MSKNDTGPMKVAIRFVDGSYSEHQMSLQVLADHDRLLQQGLQGTALINGLLGDDWAAPPREVTITGPGSDGVPIEITLHAG